MANKKPDPTPSGLPFKVAPKVEAVEIGDQTIGLLELPKRWSITPNEELLLAPMLAVVGDGRDSGKVHTFRIKVATLALQRIHPSQTERETADLPNPLVVALYDYFMAERRQWEPIPEIDLEGDTDPKAPIGQSTTVTSANTSPKPTTD